MTTSVIFLLIVCSEIIIQRPEFLLLKIICGIGVDIHRSQPKIRTHSSILKKPAYLRVFVTLYDFYPHLVRQRLIK